MKKKSAPKPTGKAAAKGNPFAAKAKAKSAATSTSHKAKKKKGGY